MSKPTPAEVEPRLLASITSPDEFFRALGAGVSAASFEGKETGAAWAYLADHMRRLQRIPTPEDFLTVTGCTIGETGDLDTYVAFVREGELARSARNILFRDGTQLDENPGRTIKLLTQHLGALSRSHIQRQIYFDKDALSRLARYDDLIADSSVLMGMPTGLESLDNARMGFRKGELVIIMASTSVGKSWFGLRFAAAAYKAGYRVLCISPEMPHEDLAMRFDVVYAAMLGHEPALSNQALMTGRADRGEYDTWLQGLTVRSDFVCIDSADTGKSMTFEDVWDLANEHAPIDVVFIDGLHLLKNAGGGNRQRWDVLMEGCATLKALAIQERKVVIAAHQTTRAAAKDTTRLPGMYQAGYGFGVMESADRVVALAADPSGDEKRRVYKFIKQRGGIKDNKARGLVFDVDVGLIHEDDREMDDLPPDTEF